MQNTLNNIQTPSVNNSYLELIIGPMFSGKTSELIEIYKKCTFCNIPVTIINHTIDKRYHETMVSNHDKIMAPCLQASELSDIWFNQKETNGLLVSDVILINEGQFFSDLYDVVVDMLRYNKKIYICGLDGDFERKKFGAVLDLIPLCDNVKKLKSLCSICRNGTPGIFSMRLSKEKEQTIVGSDNYIPVCRNCYEVKKDQSI
jgi:thymidine kinase